MFKFKLKSHVVHTTTGFTGILTAVTEQLYGVDRYYIQPPVDKDGKIPDGFWVDEQDIKVTSDENAIDIDISFKYVLGAEAESISNGFAGTIVNRVYYSNGCANYVLQPHARKSKLPESKSIAEEDIRIVLDKPHNALKPRNGGPISKSL